MHIPYNLTIKIIQILSVLELQNLITDRYKTFSQYSTPIKPLPVTPGWIDGFVIVQKQGEGGNQVTIPIMRGAENYNTYSTALSKEIDAIKISFSNNALFVDLDKSTRADLVIIQAILRYF